VTTPEEGIQREKRGSVTNEPPTREKNSNTPAMQRRPPKGELKRKKAKSKTNRKVETKRDGGRGLPSAWGCKGSNLGSMPTKKGKAREFSNGPIYPPKWVRNRERGRIVSVETDSSGRANIAKNKSVRGKTMEAREPFWGEKKDNQGFQGKLWHPRRSWKKSWEQNIDLVLPEGKDENRGAREKSNKEEKGRGRTAAVLTEADGRRRRHDATPLFCKKRRTADNPGERLSLLR